jgi:toxin ParE1/3/4
LNGRLRLTPEAEADIAAAADWYAERSKSAAQSFLLAVKDVLGKIAEAPQHAPVVVEGIRRRNLRRYPYGAWYVERSHGVLVVGVLHHRMNPAVARGRMSKS